MESCKTSHGWWIKGSKRERGQELFESRNFPIIQNMTYEERIKFDFKIWFWKLCLGTIEGDVALINDLIQKESM